LTVPLWRIDPSIAPREIGLAADPESTAHVVPSTSRASTLRFPTRTRQFGTTLPWSPPARFPLLRCSPSRLCSPRSAHIRRCARCSVRSCESRSVHSFASGNHRLATLSAFACVSLVPGWPHRALCSAWRVTEHALLFAPPGSSCPSPALPPSSSPLIRRRSHSCVFDVIHSSESEEQGQGDNAKSTGYPQDFNKIHTVTRLVDSLVHSAGAARCTARRRLGAP